VEAATSVRLHLGRSSAVQQAVAADGETVSGARRKRVISLCTRGALHTAARRRSAAALGAIWSSAVATTTLYRPVGPTELELIAASGWKSFPPRLPEQPIFYPVLNEEYAAQIAERWNVRDSGAGYVTAFDVDAEYVARFEVKQVGGREHLELWVPAEELATFNRHIVGLIRVVREFGGNVA